MLAMLTCKKNYLLFFSNNSQNREKEEKTCTAD